MFDNKLHNKLIVGIFFLVLVVNEKNVRFYGPRIFALTNVNVKTEVRLL